MPEPRDRGPAAFVAEFIGTFTLVFFVTMVVSLFVTPPVNGQQPFIDFSVIGLVHVLVLFMIVETIAVVSGAHVNPAVTLALMVIRQIKVVDGVIYWLCQLAGGVVAALVTKALIRDEGAPVHYGATIVSTHLNTFGGICAEAIGTFFLVWAIVGVAVSPITGKGVAGLVIGGTLGLGVMIMAPLTGAGFNPARSFGPAIVAHAFAPDAGKWILTYVVGPGVGGVLAALVYLYLFVLPGKRGVEGMQPVG